MNRPICHINRAKLRHGSNEEKCFLSFITLLESHLFPLPTPSKHPSLSYFGHLYLSFYLSVPSWRRKKERKEDMAIMEDVESGLNTKQIEVKKPLIQHKKEPKCQESCNENQGCIGVVLFSTAVAVCGSFEFGTCVSFYSQGKN